MSKIYLNIIKRWLLNIFAIIGATLLIVLIAMIVYPSMKSKYDTIGGLIILFGSISFSILVLLIVCAYDIIFTTNKHYYLTGKDLIEKNEYKKTNIHLKLIKRWLLSCLAIIGAMLLIVLITMTVVSYTIAVPSFMKEGYNISNILNIIFGSIFFYIIFLFIVYAYDIIFNTNNHYYLTGKDLIEKEKQTLQPYEKEENQ
ncbi:hypothetical protein Hs20B_18200 [Lactococcus insecticola]|uniref:Uncharacterized protein n=2 Tax=Pseudolactococcus insecticola TaxID=2709158 RepID=A0A6A0B804_9LACT|nr:hypothetical protein Hs20B_18200 [Lactococcus insecticola]